MYDIHTIKYINDIYLIFSVFNIIAQIYVYKTQYKYLFKVH